MVTVDGRPVAQLGPLDPLGGQRHARRPRPPRACVARAPPPRPPGPRRPGRPCGPAPGSTGCSRARVATARPRGGTARDARARHHGAAGPLPVDGPATALVLDGHGRRPRLVRVGAGPHRGAHARRPAHRRPGQRDELRRGPARRLGAASTWCPLDQALPRPRRRARARATRCAPSTPSTSPPPTGSPGPSPTLTFDPRPDPGGPGPRLRRRLHGERSDPGEPAAGGRHSRRHDRALRRNRPPPGRLGPCPRSTAPTRRLEIHKVVVGPYRQQRVRPALPETGDAVLLDAANEHEKLLELAAALDVRQVLETHGHWDHIQAVPAMRDAGYEVGVTAGRRRRCCRRYDVFLDDDGGHRGRPAPAAHHPHARATPRARSASGSRARRSCSAATRSSPAARATPRFEGGDFATIIRSIEDRLFSPLAGHARAARPRRRHHDRHRAPPPPGVGRPGLVRPVPDADPPRRSPWLSARARSGRST